MKATKNKSLLPHRLRQAIAQLGADISVARRKRSLTIGMMAERIGVHKNTYLKVEKECIVRDLRHGPFCFGAVRCTDRSSRSWPR